MGEMKNSCKVLVEKSEGRRPLCRPTHGWENNIKTYLKQVWGVWTKFFWLRIVINTELF
jgi:hypothetical protein